MIKWFNLNCYEWNRIEWSEIEHVFVCFVGQASQACDLFLKHRTALLKHSLRQLKTEGATVLYIKRITGLFFPFVVDTGKEIARVFPKNQVCASGSPFSPNLKKKLMIKMLWINVIND